MFQQSIAFVIHLRNWILVKQFTIFWFYPYGSHLFKLLFLFLSVWQPRNRRRHLVFHYLDVVSHIINVFKQQLNFIVTCNWFTSFQPYFELFYFAELEAKLHVMFKVNFIHLLHYIGRSLRETIPWLSCYVGGNVSVPEMSHSMRTLQEWKRWTCVSCEYVYLFIKVDIIKRNSRCYARIMQHQLILFPVLIYVAEVYLFRLLLRRLFNVAFFVHYLNEFQIVTLVEYHFDWVNCVLSAVVSYVIDYEFSHLLWSNHSVYVFAKKYVR